MYAAENNNLEMLKYLHKKGCFCDENVCLNAAENNNLEMLKYLYENGCKWDERVC